MSRDNQIKYYLQKEDADMPEEDDIIESEDEDDDEDTDVEDEDDKSE